MDKKTIFVVCEYKRGTNEFRRGTFELLGAANVLKEQGLNEFNAEYEVNAVVLDSGIDADFCQLSAHGAQKIIYLKNEKFKNYNCKYFSSALVELLKDKNPDIVLFLATNCGRELAPSVTSRLKTGLTADCTALSLAKHKGEIRLAATRPTFGGVLMATIMCKKNPQCATVREGVMSAKVQDFTKCNVEHFSLRPDFCTPCPINVLEFIAKKAHNNNLENARVVFAGGKGLKSKENFKKLERIAKALNVCVAASRGAVDAGFAPQSMQVGQTGKTIAPDVYVAFGISGAIHHISGMSASKTVAAINNDPNAPIFAHCDFKIEEDAIKIIDEMHSKLGID